MKILLIGPYGIGNTILSLPTIKILKKSFPDAKIDLLTLLNSTYQMVTSIPDFNLFDSVFYINFKQKMDFLKKIIQIRKNKYDYSILLFPSARWHYNLLSYLCNAKVRIGSLYPDINFKRLSFLNNINVPVIIGIHDVYQNINLLNPLKINTKNIKIKSIKSKIALKKKKKCIGFHPGSKKAGYFKRWDKVKYLQVIKKLLNYKKDYLIKLFFGPDEIDEYKYFKHNLNSSKVKFIYNKDLKNVFKEINECKIFVSNDTGLMHIANFLNCINIVIGGPSDFRRTGPFNKPHIIIRSNVKCQPCSHTYFVSSHKFKCIYNDVRCMKYIRVNEVFQNIKNFL